MRPGDRYLSVREVAQRFAVSPMTAQRAVQELADQSLLDVRPRVGTFVGAAMAGVVAPVKTVQFITQPSPANRRRLFQEGIQEGILSVFPGATIQLGVLPERDGPAYLARLVDQAREQLIGTVLLLVPRWVHEFYARQGNAAVCIGNVEDDIRLPTVNRDQRQLGRTAAEHLVTMGHRHVGLLMREIWYPGDNHLVEGAEEALLKGGSVGRLQVRSVPDEISLAGRALHRILRSPDRPTAIIARSSVGALLAAESANQLGLAVPRDLSIVAVGTDARALQSTSPPISTMSYDGWELGLRAGRALKDFAGPEAADARVELPSQLVERGSTGPPHHN